MDNEDTMSDHFKTKNREHLPRRCYRSVVRLSERQVRQLDELAYRLQMTRSEVMRAGLEALHQEVIG